MGLETNVNSIQDLNQNWPPVSDPRAQGADHLRNLKKAIQLTFPNLKQCLLNDAQFTALGTLVGDGSGTFTVKGTLLVPSVTDWATQQAVPAKDADGRYMKPGDADGRYVSKAQGTQDYAPLQAGVSISTGNIWLNYKASDGTVKYAFAQQPGDYATNTALSAEVTRATTVESNLQSSKANLNGGNLLSGHQTVNGWVSVTDAMALETVGGNGGTTVVRYTDPSGAATTDINNIATGANLSWFRLYQDGMLRTSLGDVVFNHRDIDSGPITNGWFIRIGNVVIQSFHATVSNGGWVNFPIALSVAPKISNSYHDGPYDGSPHATAVANLTNITTTGCQWFLRYVGGGNNWGDSGGTIWLTVTGQL